MTDREKPSVATSAAAGSGLAEQALSVLLTHSYTTGGDDSDSDNADLLDIATLGSLSVVSPHLLSLTQPAWRLLYRRAVTAGSPAYAVETTTYLWRSDTLLNTWSGEDGLTPCFASLSECDALLNYIYFGPQGVGYIPPTHERPS